MKFLQWNVNGLRSLLKNAEYKSRLLSLISEYDIISLNETKIDQDTLDRYKSEFVPVGYELYSTHANKKGYSGVCVITRVKPLHVLDQTLGMEEGRLVVLEYSKFILISVYTPNAGQRNLSGDKLPKRIEYRTRSWDMHFRSLCMSLQMRKPLVVLGDLNVAHRDIDIYNPNNHRHMAGMTDIERHNFEVLLSSANLVDAWRDLHPNQRQYTYFDYRTRARVRNAGWRLDYALVSRAIHLRIARCEILSDIDGSDHVPVELVLRIDLNNKK